MVETGTESVDGWKSAEVLYVEGLSVLSFAFLDAEI